jgi:DNA-binding MarR family transcriptional regulator
MAQADEIIHQQTRLKIMATLRPIPEGEWIEFTRLKAILRATDGNLGSHISTLESAGYITVRKDFVGKKPRTRVALTRSGRKAFAQHIEFLRTILDAATSDNGNAETTS